MASSRKRRKRPSAERRKARTSGHKAGTVGRLVVGLSGGVDSVVLLHLLKALEPSLGYELSAVHVHHGLSPNADRWAAFCRRLCRRWKIPLVVRKVAVAKGRDGPEAAARRARYAIFRAVGTDIALAHNLDDQAETVIMNLLRGAGLRGASGMPARAAFHGRTLLRPLLGTPRASILRYARRERLSWIEDESNADEALTRNFIRRNVGPLLERRFPRWKESVARAARHFAKREAGLEERLRSALGERKLRAPSESKLAEMLRQLASGSPRATIRHDGAALRAYRGTITLEPDASPSSFTLEFHPVTGSGIRAELLLQRRWALRPRKGGERLQPDPRRPRRTLKNLFQEAGVPPWERDRLPLLFCDDDLVWVPGIGVDARYRARRGERGLEPSAALRANLRGEE
ncbi:MAG: tRNA lysidine(34) synthetase TilS [Betaproteobacteria bacterium]|nr:tRNA lysidine(34) synthetase TilS [Betaproteobacteria bacterium]